MLVTLLTLGAEDPWGTYKDKLILDAPPKELDFFDLVALKMPEESPYLLGVEVEVVIPKDLLPYRGSFAVLIYQGQINSENSGLKNAQRLGAEVFPPVNKFYYQIPLVPQSGLKMGPDKAVLAAVPNKASGDLFVTIIPMDKSLPERIPGAELFQLKIQRILGPQGGLEFKFKELSPEFAPQIRIQTEKANLNAKGLNLLAPGIYDLSISGGPYRTQNFKVAIARGQTAYLDVTMVEAKALVRLEAPSGTGIFIDGKEISDWSTGKSIVLENGEYSVQFVVGDYKITRIIELNKPGSYIVSLFMEIQVKEKEGNL